MLPCKQPAHWQTCPTPQVSPTAAQDWHWLPPVPHMSFALPISQVLPLQHPRAHVVTLHTHEPPTHTEPVGHAGSFCHWPHMSHCWGTPVGEQRIDVGVQTGAFAHVQLPQVHDGVHDCVP